MKITNFFFVLAFALVVQIDGSAFAQTATVQLPTFHQFGVSTTVLVPHRGTAYLGGVNSSTRASNRFGFGVPGFGNQGYGHSHSAGGISLCATIIDHDEIDRALLAEAARRRGDPVDIFGRPVTDAPARVPDYVGVQQPSPVGFRDTAHNETDHRRAETSELQGSELAETYLRRGKEAEADGEYQAASIFYRKVYSLGDASQIILANERLKRLTSRISRNR